MERIGSALGDNCDLATLGPSEARSRAGRDHTELLRCLGGDGDEGCWLRLARRGNVVIGAFQVAGGVATIYVECGLIREGSGHAAAVGIVAPVFTAASTNAGADGRLQEHKRGYAARQCG